MKYAYRCGTIFVVVLLITSTVSGQETCGDITYTQFGDPTTVPIQDCGNPFNLTTDPTVTPTFTHDGMELSEGLVITAPDVVVGVPITASFTDERINQVSAELYRHVDGGYVEVINSVSPLGVRELTTTVTATGTYTFVVESFAEGNLSPAVTPRSLFDGLQRWFLPVAHAQIIIAPEFGFQRFAITFTVEQSISEPLGASSVLFLPGIQASRLYKDGLLGTEDQLWVPNGNGDVRQLVMNEAGESINDIYTRDVVDEAVGFNIYKNFLGLLDDLSDKDEPVIKDYTPFAYDWRHDVFDVATQPVAYPNDEEKSLREEVLRLAAESFTGKVTIIGHSNGGLVGKALLHEYGDTDLAGKVDKLVMIGTPQLGTPKGVGAMLHGTDQQLLGGLLVDDEVAREVIRNLPGAYSLLPSERYFSDVQTSPMISAQDVLLAEQVRQYGDIRTRDQLDAFMLDSLNVLPDNPNLNQPYTLNATLLEESKAGQTILDDWTAPTGVEVYEVVGTGLPTIAGFEYREYGCSSNPACIVNSYLKPHPIFLTTGDATVMAGSAAGYEGDKTTVVVDLVEEASFRPKNHANMTESQTIQTFLDAVIKYPYLADAVVVPDYTEVRSEYTIVGIHSPVMSRAVTSDGQQVNRDSQDIVGSQYLELGGSTYLIIPSIVTDYTVELTGTGDGVYTITIEQLGTDSQTIVVGSITANSSSGLRATIEVLGGEFGDLFSDSNGDGEVDEQWTLAGELVIVDDPTPEVVASSQGTRVADRSAAPQVLGVTTTVVPVKLSAEQRLVVLQALQQIKITLQYPHHVTVEQLASTYKILSEFQNFIK